MEHSSQSADLAAFRKLVENKILKESYPPPEERIIISKCQEPTAPSLQNIQETSLYAKPIDGTNENRVNDVDGREPILTTAQWPYSVHGVVAMKFQGVTSYGSGTLIGPNIVLTAGHNLYDYKKEIYADPETLQFLPAMNGQKLPFGVVEVEKYFVSPKYIKKQKEDYGILILKEPIGEMTGYFGLACLDSKDLENKRINVIGYPEDKVASKSGQHEMWGMNGLPASIDQRYIHYRIDTAGGQSGSAVYYEEDGNFFVCGVHVRGGRTVNSATLLTRKIYEQIYPLIREHVRKESLFRSRVVKLKSWCKTADIEHMSILQEYWGDLRGLDCHKVSMQVDVIERLAKNKSWENFSSLNLSGSQIGLEGVRALAKNKSWTGLLSLDLSRNKIGAEEVKALVQNTSWKNLKKLNLSENFISDSGVKVLGQNRPWANLSELNLDGCGIGPEGAWELSKIPWGKLEKLSLGWNQIDAKGAHFLAQNQSWTNLSELYLDRNDIGSEGVKLLAQNSSWIKLLNLYLADTKICDEGAKGLAQNTSWRNLRELNLDNNSISELGAKAISENICWESLSKLNLGRNSFKVEKFILSIDDLRSYFNEKQKKEEILEKQAENVSSKNINDFDFNGGDLLNEEEF